MNDTERLDKLVKLLETQDLSRDKKYGFTLFPRELGKPCSVTSYYPSVRALIDAAHLPGRML